MTLRWCVLGLVLASLFNLDGVTGFPVERISSDKPYRWATPSRRFYTGSTSPEEAMKRTSAHLKKLNKLSKQRQQNRERELDDARSESDSPDQEGFDLMYQEYLLQSANYLKEQLQQKKLPSKGRKPDLARRLTEYNLKLNGAQANANSSPADPIRPWLEDEQSTGRGEEFEESSATFCGLNLSPAATRSLQKADFLATPSPIQAAAIPKISAVHEEQAHPESFILHAETGSGE